MVRCVSFVLALALAPPELVLAKRVAVPYNKHIAKEEDRASPLALLEDEEQIELGEKAAPQHAPQFAANSLLEFEVNKCTLVHMEAFQRVVSRCDASVTVHEAVAMALITKQVQELTANVNGSLVVSAEDEADIHSALSLQGVFESEQTIAMCTEGADFVECVKHLHPPMWVTQRWYIMNLLREMTEEADGPAMAAFQAKLEIYKETIRAYGFSYKSTRTWCTRELSRPMEDQVRLCVINDAMPQFIEDPNSIFRSRRNMIHYYSATSLASQEHYDLSNSTSKEAALRNWLLQYYRYKDEQYTYTRFARQFMQRQCAVAIDTARSQKRLYKHAIQGTLFSIHRRAQPYCEANIQSPMEAQGFLDRMAHEVADVCDAEADCREREGVMTPEGFACDTRRAQRQGAGLALGSAAGAVTGLVIATALPVLALGAVGLVAAPLIPGVTPAAMAAAGLTLPGSGPGAIVGGALGQRQLRPTCMAFPLNCHYSPEQDRCEVVPSEQQLAAGASNPFSSGPDALPFTGFKCVRDGRAMLGMTEGVSSWSMSGIGEALSSEHQCSLKQCRPVDAVVPGPVDAASGLQLFGRVGFRAEDGGVYNCLNTNSSTHSALPDLATLPDPHLPGMRMDNNARNRAALLTMYLAGQ